MRSLSGLSFSLRACILGLTLAVWAGSAHAMPVWLDFEDGTPPDPVDDFYLASGVSFSGAEWTSNFGHPGSGGALGIRAEAGFAFSIDDAIVAVFQTDVTEVRVTALNVGEAGARIDAYDAEVGGNLVDSFEVVGISQLGTDEFFELKVLGTNIRRVEIYQPLETMIDGVWFDDFHFTLVPEPGTAGLMALGLGLLAVRRRR
ncbi:MAG: PEP-CTERM sorting domain-containing protein [Proteobacteria bacterium]|nr:PEP-CTERM sorting domain-containing protein [Pseudomonadota bacterium]